MKKGTILGLLGRNGAGKTTMMKCLLGLNTGFAGEICFEGESLTPESEALKTKVGSLVDIEFYQDLSAWDNLWLAAMLTEGLDKQAAKQKIPGLLQMVELEPAKHKKVKTFSFGMKQRLALAQAFLSDPTLLILDEPFVGLDPIGIDDMKKLFRRLCKEEHLSIIFSSHQLDEVEDLAEDIMVLSKGKIQYRNSYQNIQNNNISLLDLMR